MIYDNSRQVWTQVRPFDLNFQNIKMSHLESYSGAEHESWKSRAWSRNILSLMIMKIGFMILKSFRKFSQHYFLITLESRL